MLHHEFELELTPLEAFNPTFGRRLTRFYKKGGGSAPTPDPNIGLAALENAQLGKDWLDFAKDQFEIGNNRQEAIDKISSQISGAQLESLTHNNAMAKEQWDIYQKEYRPLEQKMLEEAQNYDSPERQAAEAAKARSEVMQNASVMQKSAQRNMQRMGVNPNSGRFQENSAAMGLDTALGAAQAENAGRQKISDMGIMLRKDAANFGRNMPGTAAQAYSVGNSAGQGAMGAALGAHGAWQGNQNIMGQGFQGAMSGNSSMAGILNQQYGNQMQGWMAQQQAGSSGAAGLGSMVGMLGSAAIGAWSSKKLKINKRPTTLDALAAINQMEVGEWRYIPGVSDEGEHIGVYAEDFKEATGKGDGVSLPYVDALGVLMKAVQQLSAQVSDLQEQLAEKEAE